MTPIPEIELHPEDASHGSGSGTNVGYKVETRSSYPQPTILGAFVIDAAWRQLPIHLGATQWGANIPVKSYETEMGKHGIFSYIVAEAHRWAFLAALEAGGVTGSLCIETRLVRIEHKYSYALNETGVSETLREYARIHANNFTPRAGSPAASKASK